VPPRLAKKVLLIGWDAADWKVITPLLDRGLLPTLARFIEDGVMGNIATLDPVLSPMLWTTIATGKRADKHGILGFVEPDPASGRLRPVSSPSRRAKALWNILSQEGLRSHVVGWYASHPAEPIEGAVVTNLYAQAVAGAGEPWPLKPGTVHPRRLEEALAEARVHPAELEAGHLLPFVPGAARVDQEKDGRLRMLARILAENASVHAAATHLLEHEPWDFAAVYYDGIDHLGHGFMPYHPPRMEGVSEDDFEIYKDVVTGAYRFHDMMLERLLGLAGDDATAILVSDHGFHSDHLRPRRPGLGIDEWPVLWHRPLGIVCLKGPGIRRDERIYGATLLDVAPTVLTLLGLPVGADMEGRPLLQAFDEPPAVERIESWEARAGSGGMHGRGEGGGGGGGGGGGEDPWDAREALRQLVDLGYVEAPGEDVEKAVARAGKERRYNLARVHIDADRPAEAATVLEGLHGEFPDEPRFAYLLARCRLKARDLAGCRALVEHILGLVRRAENERAEAAAKRGSAAPREDRPPERRPGLDLLRGNLAYAEGRTAEALAFYLEAGKASPRLPALHGHIGRAYLRLGRPDDAERAYRRALEIDPESADAHDGLAASLIRLGRDEEAAEAALRAVGILHHLPRAHFHLGVALARLGLAGRALQAFETCVAMRPAHRLAHRWLSRLHEVFTRDAAKAAAHRERAREPAP